jgi:chromosome segregation ATPase
MEKYPWTCSKIDKAIIQSVDEVYDLLEQVVDERYIESEDFDIVLFRKNILDSITDAIHAPMEEVRALNSDMRDFYEEQVNECEQEIDSLKLELSSQEDEIYDLEDTIKELMEKIDELRREIEDMEESD